MLIIISFIMKLIKKIGVFALSLIALNASAQTDKATTAKIVGEKNYIFVATSAIPLNSTDINNVLSKMNGQASVGTINLSGDNYDLKITGDSIVSYLPFYGRAYSAPYGANNSESGYKFTSKQFNYEAKGKKKGWNITIQTKDVRDNVRMTLSITESGYATLSVNSNNKQSITYNGYLSEVKKETPSK